MHDLRKSLLQVQVKFSILTKSNVVKYCCLENGADNNWSGNLESHPTERFLTSPHIHKSTATGVLEASRTLKVELVGVRSCRGTLATSLNVYRVLCKGGLEWKPYYIMRLMYWWGCRCSRTYKKCRWVNYMSVISNHPRSELWAGVETNFDIHNSWPMRITPK